MFGIEATNWGLIILIALLVLLGQWCVGYGVLRWTPLGGVYERWRERRPGWLITWFTGMVIWMFAASIGQQFLDQ